jgi:peptidoglycan/xylan/chitin deacetylase (PgdA/CDA1 family)
MFPHGTRGAVSLTYDDALDVHFAHAMPDLEAAGLRGTFYVPTGEHPVMNWTRRRDHWRAAAARGHEVGNHTVHHPCASCHAFVKKGFTLEEYDLPRIEAELRQAADALRQGAGEAASRSFAYTCCEDFVGPDHTSFRPVCQKLFLASRGGGPAPDMADPANFDLNYVPSWALVEQTPLDQILTFLDTAADRGHWAVLQFHGVGGGHGMNVTRETHQAICRHLAELRAQLWCGTFVEVAIHLRQATVRPWPGK